MKLPSPYICDECGTQKKESNHWWLLTIFECETGDKFEIGPWNEDDVQDGVKHLCSESCATKALSKWMASFQSANEQLAQPVETAEESAINKGKRE